MAGQVKVLIDKFIAERSKGNSTIANATKAKLILKGINPDNWNISSPDDYQVIIKIKELAKESGINI